MTVFEPQYMKNIQWYFEDRKLIFTESLWTITNTDKVKSNDKSYLKNEHLIAFRSMDGMLDPNSKIFKDLDKQLYEYAQKIKNEH